MMEGFVVIVAIPAMCLLLGCLVVLIVIAVTLREILGVALWLSEGEDHDPDDGEPVFEEPTVVRLVARGRAA